MDRSTVKRQLDARTFWIAWLLGNRVTKKGGYVVFRILKIWYPSASVNLAYPAFDASSMRFSVSGSPSLMVIDVYSSGSFRFMFRR